MFIMLTMSSTKKNLLVAVDKIVSAYRPDKSLITYLKVDSLKEITIFQVAETPEYIYKEILKCNS